MGDGHRHPVPEQHRNFVAVATQELGIGVDVQSLDGWQRQRGGESKEVFGELLAEPTALSREQREFARSDSGVGHGLEGSAGRRGCSGVPGLPGSSGLSSAAMILAVCTGTSPTTTT